jgi:hypothetical protein
MHKELDLHGLTILEAVELFIGFYNSQIKKGDYSRFEVIHGYGSSGEGGAIRGRLRSFLARHGEFLSFVAGEECRPPNPGKTLVCPVKPLPSTVDILAEEILAYCEVAKTITKISGRFRRHGEAKVQVALKNLEKLNLLTSFYKGQYRHYQAK